jgi:putative thiamine transport system permease protein
MKPAKAVSARNPFGWAQPLTIGIFVGPILLGLFGTLLPAFGVQPALGQYEPSLEAWRNLITDPTIAKSLRLTLTVGFGATLIAVVFGFGSVALLHGTRAFAIIRSFLAPALAFPHASFAVGLAFLIAPSGWIARLFSPWATGWEHPPDLMIVRDPDAIALMLALALKESLFLILMIVGALGQINAELSLRSARSMGYSPTRAWLIVIAPQIYAQVRLPIYAMLASALAIVDMAIVLGPAAPPPLAPLTLDWYRELDTGRQLMASAAAIFQLLLVIAAILLWRLGEVLINRTMRSSLTKGIRRGWAERIAGGAGSFGISLALAASLGAIIMLFLWSFAGSWSWPDALPQRWSAAMWISTSDALVLLVGRSMIIGIVASVIATALAICCLEAGIDQPRPRWFVILYVPLLVPQISFLFGVQLLWNRLWLDGTLIAVTLTHLLFVLPYVLLVLSDPYRALDPRIAIAARSLGASRIRTLLQIKLPLLARPVATAMAIGFAVSIGQYLPTVFAGAGRVDTLTTEAVALASGADRRLAGVIAFALTALPFFALAMANIAPNRLERVSR